VRLFSLVLLITTLLWGPELDYWNFSDRINSKKDELITYRLTDVEQEGLDWNLTFRWTLVKEKGVVMLYDLNRFKAQNILYPKVLKLDTHSIVWRERKEGTFEKPTIWIVAEEIHDANKTVTFVLYVRSEGRQIEVKRLKK
jgi:hypothetical protein